MVAELRLFGAPAVLDGQGERLLAPRRPHQLLAFLACRRHWVMRAELAELFWPDRPEGAARTNLRVLLQRAQQEHPGLELQAERVRWLVASDLARFEDAVAARRDAEALALYRPPLLEGLEAGLPEPLLDWLAHERRRVAGLWRAASQRAAAGAVPAHGRGAAEPVEAPDLAADFPDEPRLAGAWRADPHAFVGRRAELADLASRFAAGTRVVVVTGVGGIGKSALLRAALPLLRPLCGGAADLVPLADLTDPAQVPARVAATLGITLRAGIDLWAQLAPALGPAPRLVALDNAEHLAGLAPQLEALCRAVPGLRLLIGSRERLALQGSVLPLEGLPLPDADDDTASLRQFDAVRLFEARAQAVAPGFDALRERQPMLRVLAATEGLPLALELAAVATRFLPLAALADELDRTLEVLDAGAPGRGLRACFERSFARLAEPERAGLSRLAWLPGPFTRDMADEVAGVPLAGLAALVDRSLLRMDRRGRFSLHALLRQYMSTAHPPADAPALALRHAAHINHRLAPFESPRQLRSSATLRALDDELPHVLAAWAWAVAAPAPNVAARLARVMGHYFQVRGRAQEILPFLAHAVAALDGPGRAVLAARALTLRTQAMLEYHSRALEAAQQHARQALRWARQAGDAGTALACLTVLGNALYFSGEVRAARPHFEQAYRQGLARADLAIAASAVNGLGLVARGLGRYDEAREHFRAGGRLGAELGNLSAQVVALINIGNLQMVEARWEDARRTNEEALAIVDAERLESYRAILETVLGEVAVESGRLADARAHLGRALAALPNSGDNVVPTQAHLSLARVALAEGRAEEAAVTLVQGINAARDSGSSTMQLSSLNVTADFLAQTGHRDAAEQLWSQVLGHPAATPTIKSVAERGLGALGVPVRPAAEGGDVLELLEAAVARLVLPAPIRP